MKTNINLLQYMTQFFLEWKTFQTKVVEKFKTRVLFSVTFFALENRAIYEIMWKNVVERGRPQMTTRRMRIACWVLKATDIHSEYVIPIVFPLQQWLQESASVSRYTHIARLVGLWHRAIRLVGTKGSK